MLWAGAGRSPATAARAAAFTDVGDLATLVGASEVILSVCPPEAALDVARSVASYGFGGVYADLNACSPQTVRAIAELFDTSADVVDGGIVGGPSTEDAVVHLAGVRAGDVAAIFAPAVVRTAVLPGSLGSASALKACYASSTKAVSALLLMARAAAAQAGVEAELLAEWERSTPGQVARSDRSLASVGEKAWRFGGEMREAAAFFASVGVPDGFSLAAGEVYDRVAPLRERPYEPDEVLDLVSRAAPPPSS